MSSVIGTAISLVCVFIACVVFGVFAERAQLKFERRRIEMIFNELDKRGFVSIIYGSDNTNAQQ